MSKFISIKDKLPKLDQTVIVLIPSGYDGRPQYYWGGRIDDSEGWVWGVGGSYGVCPLDDVGTNDIECDDDYNVTHWMPLPEPPK